MNGEIRYKVQRIGEGLADVLQRRHTPFNRKMSISLLNHFSLAFLFYSFHFQ